MYLCMYLCTYLCIYVLCCAVLYAEPHPIYHYGACTWVSCAFLEFVEIPQTIGPMAWVRFCGSVENGPLRQFLPKSRFDFQKVKERQNKLDAKCSHTARVRTVKISQVRPKPRLPCKMTNRSCAHGGFSTS